MRRCLMLVAGLLAGCITASETDNAGIKTTRTYALFVPVSKSVSQSKPRQSPADTKIGQNIATGESSTSGR